ncbi:hypothetical protein D3C71_1785210 [compost metagenome]
MQGLFGARDLLPFRLRDRQPGVIDAIGGYRPAVVFPCLRNIDLIATAWTVFVLPHHPAPRIQRQPLRITVAVGPNFRPLAGLADKRIIRRYRAVGG